MYASCENSRTLLILAALLVLFRNRRSSGGLVAYFLGIALPKTALAKLIQTYVLPAIHHLQPKKEIASNVSTSALHVLDIPTAAFVNALQWLIGKAPPASIRGQMEVVTLIQTVLGKVVEGIKSYHVETSTGAGSRGTVEGHWIVQDASDVPFSSNDTVNKQVLLYFHGGGYDNSNSQTFINHHATLIKTFNEKAKLNGSSKRLVIFSVEYPLAPEHTYPAALHSAIDAVRWLVNNIGVSSLAIGGDSAGANLAIYLLKALHDDPAYKSYFSTISASLLISPWVDLTATVSKKGFESNDFFTSSLSRVWGRAFAGSLSMADARVSPCFLKAEELVSASEGTLVIYGGSERLAPAIETFLETLKESNPKNLVIHKGIAMPHDFNLILLSLHGTIGRTRALAAINESATFLLSLK
ncbi:Alpha/Beta hydrolase protein [Chytridium lagenaria]|nr:Alpha/Beta hydrolase protein [Chytridium lagenaria]